MIAKTYSRVSCEGHIYVIINRDEKSKFISLLISPPAKTNDCGGSWAYAIQDLLTFILRREEGEKDLSLILKALKGHFCNAMRPNAKKCRSCVDAIGSVLKEDFNEIHAKVV